jgi:transposase
MEVTTIGIDLAKSAFVVSGADSSGRVVMRRQLWRAQVLSFMRGLPRCTVGWRQAVERSTGRASSPRWGMRCGL